MIPLKQLFCSSPISGEDFAHSVWENAIQVKLVDKSGELPRDTFLKEKLPDYIRQLLDSDQEMQGSLLDGVGLHRVTVFRQVRSQEM